MHTHIIQDVSGHDSSNVRMQGSSITVWYRTMHEHEWSGIVIWAAIAQAYIVCQGKSTRKSVPVVFDSIIGTIKFLYT